MKALNDAQSLQGALESIEEKMKSTVEKDKGVIDKLQPDQKISAGNLIQLFHHKFFNQFIKHLVTKLWRIGGWKKSN